MQEDSNDGYALGCLLKEVLALVRRSARDPTPVGYVMPLAQGTLLDLFV